MKKGVMLAVAVCIIQMTVSGCGQKEPEDSGREVSVNQSPDIVASIETAGAFVNAEFLDRVKASGEDPYAIYQRFLDSEEPLYFSEDTFFYSANDGLSYYFDAEKPYTLYEICNIINIVLNSGDPVNELNDNISYAYIDCGLDGNAELAIAFDDLKDYNEPADVTLVIKDMDGRLELCYLVQPSYRETWFLANTYGQIEHGSLASSGVYCQNIGYITADGGYHMVYSEVEDQSFYWKRPDDFPSGILDDNVIEIKTYLIGEGEDSREYHLLTVDGQDPKETSVDMSSLFWAVTDTTGMEFCSYEEIQRIIAVREAELGLTEEIRNGPLVEWYPLSVEGYDLIYGVESTSGVSDKARAIEACRRFLADPGHFKEILGDPMVDGLEVNNDGMVDGFFLKDLDNDDIPELLIGMSDARVSQYVYIYKFDKDSGRMKKDYVIKGLEGWFSCDEETYEIVAAVYPEFRESLLFTTNYVNDRQRIGYNDAGQLVWFEHYAGIDLNTSVSVSWCDYENIRSVIRSYMEDGGYEYDPEWIHYEVKGVREDAEKALQGYRPFLFYDINQENIDRYVVEDYLGAGMEQYNQQDVTDDIDRFDRLYEEYARGENVRITGIFTGEKVGQRYNLDKLVQLGY